ncbi:hypothetical protein HNP46_000070 [Pseudomonas nitritireducens]|uniref:LysM domain-containing protein n=1 Tax=Pseudomonas nitroreducens TaxID=46680 RepID=A0A7W7NZ54_PSENT|nr:LysM peptidoglycan-binding domain-containing protein [Pseudomonas nitritireducens]MBB4861259.1 hypothetical protein [Pseudomonas nitritireducens]
MATDLNPDIDVSLHDSKRYMQYLMVIRELERQGRFEELLQAVMRQEKNRKDPRSVFETLFQDESIAESQAMFEDVWTAVAKQANDFPINSYLEGRAGLTQEEIGKLPAEFTDFLKTTGAFEEAFPDASRPLLGARVAAVRDNIVHFLNSEHGHKALNVAALGIACASGTIVTKIGFKAGVYLARKLGENESVRSLAKTLADKITDSLEKQGVPTSKIADKFAEMKETAAAIFGSETFKKYGVPTIALAGLCLGASHIDFGSVGSTVENLASNYDATMEGINSSIQAGMASGSESIQHGAEVAFETASEYGAAAGAVVGHAYMDTADFIIKATTHPVEALADINNAIASAFHGAVDASKDLASSGYAAVAEAGSKFTGELSEQLAVAGDTIGTHYPNLAAAGHVAGDSLGVVRDGAEYAYNQAAELGKRLAGTEFFPGAGGSVHLDASGNMFAGIPGVDPSNGYSSEDALMDDSPVVPEAPAEVHAESPVVTPNADVPVAPESTAPAEAVVAPSAEVVPTHTVVKGDSLWKIAEKSLSEAGVPVTNASVTNAVNALYEANKELIGSNPNILPLVTPDGHPFVLQVPHQVIDPSYHAPVRPLADHAASVASVAHGPAAVEKMAQAVPKGTYSREDLDLLFSQTKGKDSGLSL